jgi:hypothetical protein
MPPEDLHIVLIINDGIEIEGERFSAAWEVQYMFRDFYWHWDGDMVNELNIENAILRVTANGETFELNIDTEFLNDDSNNHSFIMLNVKDKTIAYRIALSRAIFLISLRVSFLLIVAGFLFYLFGYRKNRSWIVFAVISLPVEVVINILLNGTSKYYSNAVLITLLAFYFATPLFILKIIALIAMCISINEHKKIRTVLYVSITTLINFCLLQVLALLLPF